MAILFDLHGVLIDSLELHRRVWYRWALGHGLDAVPVFEATFGRRPVDTIHAVAGHLVPDDEIVRLEALLDTEADAVRLHPGALAAVQCAALGRWAIVTSTEQGRPCPRLPETPRMCGTGGRDRRKRCDERQAGPGRVPGCSPAPRRGSFGMSRRRGRTSGRRSRQAGRSGRRRGGEHLARYRAR